jgi:predicted RNase H-like HicB family nuclease
MRTRIKGGTVMRDKIRKMDLRNDPAIDNVSFTGRALLIKEDEEEDAWWIYGVQPGSVAECGSTKEEALEAFKGMLTNIVHDLRGDLDGFLKDVDTHDDKIWHADEDDDEDYTIRIEYEFSCRVEGYVG